MALRSRHAAWFAAALLASTVLASPALAQALVADTPSTTAAGTPFTAPKSWTLINADGLANGQPPRPCLHHGNSCLPKGECGEADSRWRTGADERLRTRDVCGK